jgi:hypothetical protein
VPRLPPKPARSAKADEIEISFPLAKASGNCMFISQAQKLGRYEIRSKIGEGGLKKGDAWR